MTDWLSLPKRERIERFSKRVITTQLNLSNVPDQNDTCQTKQNKENNGEDTPLQNSQVQKRTSGIKVIK